MRQVKYARAATRGLGSIFSYLLEHAGAEVADRTVRRIVRRVQMLAHHPEMGAPYPPRADTRKLVCGLHVIIYRVIDPGTVAVLTIRHSARGQWK